MTKKYLHGSHVAMEAASTVKTVIFDRRSGLSRCQFKRPESHLQQSKDLVTRATGLFQQSELGNYRIWISVKLLRLQSD